MAEKEEKTELLKFEEFSNLYNEKIATEKKLKDAEKELAEFQSQTADDYALKNVGQEPKRPLAPYVAFPWGVILFGAILAILAVGTIVAIISIISSFAKGDVDGITLGTQLCFICIPIIIVAIIVSIKWIIPNFAEELDSLQRDIYDKKTYPDRLQKYEKATEKRKKQIANLKKEYSKIKTELSEKVKCIKQQLTEYKKQIAFYDEYLEAVTTLDFKSVIAGKKNPLDDARIGLNLYSCWIYSSDFEEHEDATARKYTNYYTALFNKWKSKSAVWCAELKELIVEYLKSSNDLTFSDAVKRIVKILESIVKEGKARKEEYLKEREKWELCLVCKNYINGRADCPKAPRNDCDNFVRASQEYIDYKLSKVWEESESGYRIMHKRLNRFKKLEEDGDLL